MPYVHIFSTDRSISEIALELGWFDLAHFDKQFHQSLGMTPSAYRKLSCAEK